LGVEIWFKEDIRNILLSVNVSSAATAKWSNDPEMIAYRQGYQAALAAVALACGISPALIGLVADYELMRVPTLLATPDDHSW
jgi:hypothetical protein